MMPSEKALKALGKLRVRIDRADRTLLKALASRFVAVEEVGAIKAAEAIPVYQKGRWLQLKRDRLAQARALGLSPGMVRALLEIIHDESLKVQRRKRKRK